MVKFPPFHPVVASYVNSAANRRALGLGRVPEHVHGDPKFRMISHNTSTGEFHYVDAEPVCGDLTWDAERGQWVCLDQGEQVSWSEAEQGWVLKDL